MHLKKRVDAFELKDKLVFDEQIKYEFPRQPMTAIYNRNTNLPLETDSIFGKFVRHGFLVDRFEQPRPEFLMNPNRATNDSLAQPTVVNQSHSDPST